MWTSIKLLPIFVCSWVQQIILESTEWKYRSHRLNCSIQDFIFFSLNYIPPCHNFFFLHLQSRNWILLNLFVYVLYWRNDVIIFSFVAYIFRIQLHTVFSSLECLRVYKYHISFACSHLHCSIKIIAACFLFNFLRMKFCLLRCRKTKKKDVLSYSHEIKKIKFSNEEQQHVF